MSGMSREQFEAFKLEVERCEHVAEYELGVEVMVDGEWVEIGEFPGERVYEDGEYYVEFDWGRIAEYPEIERELQSGLAMDASMAAADRAQRRAESGYAQ